MYLFVIKPVKTSFSYESKAATPAVYYYWDNLKHKGLKHQACSHLSIESVTFFIAQ